MENKTLAFEYFVSKLKTWYEEETKNFQSNDLGALKTLKLLFFCSAINTKKDDKETLLDTTFKHFCAMPYGHVESDIYKAIRSNSLIYWNITNKGLIQKENTLFNYDIEDGVKEKIDNSFESLKLANPNLIKMNSFDLVELSHNWYSWRYYFSIARNKGIYSEPIPSEIIKAEEKIFSIN